MLSATVLLYIIGFSSAKTDYNCPDGTGPIFIQHPTNCNKYIECNYGFGKERNCPIGYDFNPEIIDCVPADQNNCKLLTTTTDSSTWPRISTTGVSTTDMQTSTTEIPTSTVQISTIDPSEECPSTGGAVVPHPTDCTKFIMCMNGIGVVNQCDNGEHYSPTEKRCMPPELAGCIPELTTTTQGTTINPSNECPLNETAFIPYPTDCTKYIFCMFGEGVSYDCPKGEHFSPTELECMPEYEAGCIKTSTYSPPTTPPPTINPSDLCPATGSSLMPYPTDCSKYVMCMSGQGTLKECPAGEHFSPIYRICMSEDEAGCMMPTTTTPTEGTTINPSDECPPNGSAFVPHPTNCTKYIFCMFGEGTLHECPNGEHFSPTQLQCKPKNTAGCIKTTTEPPSTQATTTNYPSYYCPPTGSSLEPHPDDCSKYIICMSGHGTIMKCSLGEHFSPTVLSCVPENEAGCKPATTTTSTEGTTINPSNECPPTGSGFYPHPSNCTKYIFCMGGEGVLMECPKGEHFSPWELECRPENVANCILTTTTPLPTTTPPTTILTTINPSDLCPPTCLCFVPHPTDCDKYILCIEGEGIVEECTAEDHFSPTELECQPIEEAGCLKPSTTEGTTINPSEFCPADGFAFVPYPTDCSKFIVCTSGNGRIMSCNEGEHFSPTELICLPEHLAWCGYPTTTEGTTPATTYWK